MAKATRLNTLINLEELFKKFRTRKVILRIEIDGFLPRQLTDLNSGQGPKIIQITDKKILLKGDIFNDPTVIINFSDIYSLRLTKTMDLWLEIKVAIAYMKYKRAMGSDF